MKFFGNFEKYLDSTKKMQDDNWNISFKDTVKSSHSFEENIGGGVELSSDDGDDDDDDDDELSPPELLLSVPELFPPSESDSESEEYPEEDFLSPDLSSDESYPDSALFFPFFFDFFDFFFFSSFSSFSSSE